MKIVTVILRTPKSSRNKFGTSSKGDLLSDESSRLGRVKAPFRGLGVCFLLLLTFSSCTSNRIYEHYASVENYNWDIKDTKQFTAVINPEADKRYNFSINLRHTEAFPYSNIWLRLITKTPSGKISVNRIPLVLASQSGQWLGVGIGDIFDTRFPVISNITLPEKGIYTFAIQHDMRTDIIPGIMDVGLRIEEAK
ncbi:MAG: gliding motility lipoprotein GldH [Bacteroidetes bacterium]|nr:gliding motility lipoprotein GldH [Bacteroidota bacterium]